MDGRVRLSRASVDVHTAQWQPSVGTPIDVPEPRMVSFSLDMIPRKADAKNQVRTEKAICDWPCPAGRRARRRNPLLSLLLRLLGHGFRGSLGDFHKRQLQAADHFDQQIFV